MATGDSCRDKLYEVCEKNLEALAQNNNIDDARKQLTEETVELGRIEADMKKSDTEAYKAQMDYEARLAEVKQKYVQCAVETTVKVTSAVLVLAMIKGVAMFEKEGSFNKTVFNLIPTKLFKLC